jgi:cell division protein FtsB
MARRRLNFIQRRNTNSRTLVLGFFLFFLALAIAPPVQHYFSQRAEISAVESQIKAGNSALTQARKELELWRDPEFVKSQARARLHFVLPGERQYIVTDAATEAADASKTEVASNIPVGLPWYNRLIASITETGKN